MKKNVNAKKLGSLGGLKRAQRLSTERKKEIAAAGARARLLSLKKARHFAANFRFAQTVALLSPKRPKVARLKNPKGQLPGLYPHK